MSKKQKKLDYLVESAKWQNDLLWSVYGKQTKDTGNPDPNPPPPPPKD